MSDDEDEDDTGVKPASKEKLSEAEDRRARQRDRNKHVLLRKPVEKGPTYYRENSHRFQGGGIGSDVNQNLCVHCGQKQKAMGGIHY